MKKTLYIPLLVLFLFITKGCGCTSDNPPTEKQEEIEHLDEDFDGPTALPFSVGPSEPPPSE